jgi:hypothetical protein
LLHLETSEPMKFILELLFSFIRQSFKNWIKVEILKICISLVHCARSFIIVLSLLFFMFIILLCGFIGIHIAFFYLVPWSAFTKALILLIISIIYLLGAFFTIVVLSARKRWYRITGLEALAARWAKTVNKE